MMKSGDPDWPSVAQTVVETVKEIAITREGSRADIDLIACWAKQSKVFAIFHSRFDDPDRTVRGLVYDVRVGNYENYYSGDPTELGYEIYTYAIVEPAEYEEPMVSSDEAIHWRFVPERVPVPRTTAEIDEFRGSFS
ncbi:hypothetical protein GCM10009624_19380 [Gordonia sinesedis]